MHGMHQNVVSVLTHGMHYEVPLTHGIHRQKVIRDPLGYMG